MQTHSTPPRGTGSCAPGAGCDAPELRTGWSCPSHGATPSRDAAAAPRPASPGGHSAFCPEENPSRVGPRSGGSSRGSEPVATFKKKIPQTFQTCPSPTCPRSSRGARTSEGGQRPQQRGGEPHAHTPTHTPRGAGRSRAESPWEGEQPSPLCSWGRDRVSLETATKALPGWEVSARTFVDTRGLPTGYSKAGGWLITYQNRFGPRIRRTRGSCSRPAGKGRRQRDPRTRSPSC